MSQQLLPLGRKSHFGNAAFPPPAAHGSIGRGYSSSLHLYLPYLLSDVSVALKSSLSVKKNRFYGFLLTFARKQGQTVFLRIHSFFCIDNTRHLCFLFTYSREYCINYVYNTHIHSFYRNYQSIFLQNSSKFYIVFADFRSDFCLFYLSYFYFSPFSLCNSLKLNNYTYIY